MKIGPHRISISFYCYKIAVLFCFPYYVFYGIKKVLCRKECLESKPKYSNVMAIKKTINNFHCIFFSVEYHFSYDKKNKDIILAFSLVTFLLDKPLGGNWKWYVNLLLKDTLILDFWRWYFFGIKTKAVIYFYVLNKTLINKLLVT